MIELKIAQYNMHKSKNVMMISMLRDAALKGIHILAVQKPWQNLHMNITHCPSSCGYWPVYSAFSKYEAEYSEKKELLLHFAFYMKFSDQNCKIFRRFS